MSEQLTSQSRSNESGISRRTALRGAAWSASAVTVVVAVPAYAATSGKSGSAIGTIDRGAAQSVTGTFTFENSSGVSYPLIVVIASTSGPTTLTPGTVAANRAVTLPLSFELASNGNRQTVTMTCYHDSIAEAHKLGALTFVEVNKNRSDISGTWSPAL